MKSIARSDHRLSRQGKPITRLPSDCLNRENLFVPYVNGMLPSTVDRYVRSEREYVSAFKRMISAGNCSRAWPANRAELNRRGPRSAPARRHRPCEIARGIERRSRPPRSGQVDPPGGQLRTSLTRCNAQPGDGQVGSHDVLHDRLVPTAPLGSQPGAPPVWVLRRTHFGLDARASEALYLGRTSTGAGSLNTPWHKWRRRASATSLALPRSRRQARALQSRARPATPRAARSHRPPSRTAGRTALGNMVICKYGYEVVVPFDRLVDTAFVPDVALRLRSLACVGGA